MVDKGIPCLPFPTKPFKNGRKLLEILEDCIVFLNERIYISALYRRHKCAVQVKKVVGPKAHNKP